MKITSSQYAKTLNELTRGKSHEQINYIVAEFIKLIASKNQARIIPQIIEKFKAIWNKENGVVEAEVISREALNEKVLTEVSTYVSIKYKANKVVLNNIVNESIKGGIIIRVGDEVMDGSVENNLKKLKLSLAKN